jgi:hypothetical protein
VAILRNSVSFTWLRTAVECRNRRGGSATRTPQSTDKRFGQVEHRGPPSVPAHPRRAESTIPPERGHAAGRASGPPCVGVQPVVIRLVERGLLRDRYVRSRFRRANYLRLARATRGHERHQRQRRHGCRSRAGVGCCRGCARRIRYGGCHDLPGNVGRSTQPDRRRAFSAKANRLVARV